MLSNLRANSGNVKGKWQDWQERIIFLNFSAKLCGRFEGWDSQTNTMRVVPGKYQIFVGGSSAEAAKNVIEVKVK